MKTLNVIYNTTDRRAVRFGESAFAQEELAAGQEQGVFSGPDRWRGREDFFLAMSLPLSGTWTYAQEHYDGENKLVESQELAAYSLHVLAGTGGKAMTELAAGKVIRAGTADAVSVVADNNRIILDRAIDIVSGVVSRQELVNDRYIVAHETEPIDPAAAVKSYTVHAYFDGPIGTIGSENGPAISTSWMYDSAENMPDLLRAHEYVWSQNTLVKKSALTIDNERREQERAASHAELKKAIDAECDEILKKYPKIEVVSFSTLLSAVKEWDAATDARKTEIIQEVMGDTFTALDSVNCADLVMEAGDAPTVQQVNDVRDSVVQNAFAFKKIRGQNARRRQQKQNEIEASPDPKNVKWR